MKWAARASTHCRLLTRACMMRIGRMLRMYLLTIGCSVMDLARTANRSRCFASLLCGS